MNIRRARAQDSEMIWQWRNDPLTRHMSLSSDELPYDQHLVWFEASLKDPSTLILIGETNTSRTGNDATNSESPFAMLRLNFISRAQLNSYNEALISVNLNPAFRGRSMSAAFIEASLAWLRLHQRNLTIKIADVIEINAQIKEENKASIKCFERLGFQHKNHVTDKYLKHYCLVFNF